VLQHTGGFARERRLKGPAEYQQIFRAPCRSTDEMFLVIARKNGLNYARLGLAISKKWVKQAVVRNRLKRLARESFRRNQQLLSGMDVVVMTNKRPGPLINKAINDSLQRHWQRLVTCKNSSLV
jgi:ribonuclease P protein component